MKNMMLLIGVLTLSGCVTPVFIPTTPSPPAPDVYVNIDQSKYNTPSAPVQPPTPAPAPTPIAINTPPPIVRTVTKTVASSERRNRVMANANGCNTVPPKTPINPPIPPKPIFTEQQLLDSAYVDSVLVNHIAQLKRRSQYVRNQSIDFIKAYNNFLECLGLPEMPSTIVADQANYDYKADGSTKPIEGVDYNVESVPDARDQSLGIRRNPGNPPPPQPNKQQQTPVIPYRPKY